MLIMEYRVLLGLILTFSSIVSCDSVLEYYKDCQSQTYCKTNDTQWMAFERIPDSILITQSPNIMELPSLDQCKLECLKAEVCIGMNWSDGNSSCWILDQDKYNPNTTLSRVEPTADNKTTSHFFIYNQCEKQPCQNNGSCLPDYENDNYTCTCHSNATFRSTGIHCEHLKVGMEAADYLLTFDDLSSPMLIYTINNSQVEIPKIRRNTSCISDCSLACVDKCNGMGCFPSCYQNCTMKCPLADVDVDHRTYLINKNGKALYYSNQSDVLLTYNLGRHSCLTVYCEGGGFTISFGIKFLSSYIAKGSVADPLDYHHYSLFGTTDLKRSNNGVTILLWKGWREIRVYFATQEKEIQDFTFSITDSEIQSNWLNIAISVDYDIINVPSLVYINGEKKETILTERTGRLIEDMPTILQFGSFWGRTRIDGVLLDNVAMWEQAIEESDVLNLSYDENEQKI